MKTKIGKTGLVTRFTLLLTLLFFTGAYADDDESGLSAEAMGELQAAGVDKYLGTSQSVASEYGEWTKHDVTGKPPGTIEWE